MNFVRNAVLGILATSALAVVVACGGNKPAGTTGAANSPAAVPPPPVRGLAPAASNTATDGGVPKSEFQENDFQETEQNRDPFRSFAKIMAQEGSSHGQRQLDVVLDKFSIEDLKLVGIVTGEAEHKALLIDPGGLGWVVKRGQFIGRAEVVHSKGQSRAEYELYWRVDRIRDGDIVLVREDPAHSDVPAATRVIPLRPENEEAARGK